MDNRHLSAVSMQFSLGCGLCTATMLMLLQESLTLSFYPLALIVYSPLIYIANRLFLRRERTMAGLTLLNAGAVIAMLAAICLLDGWGGFSYMLFAVIFCVCPTMNAAILSRKAPEIHSLILCLDIMVVILVLFSAVARLSGNTEFWMLFPGAAGCAASFLALLTRRSGRTMGFKDWSLVLAVFGALSAVLWLVMRYAALAGGGLVAAWNGTISFIKYCLLTLWKVLEYLLSLLHHSDYDESVMEIPTVVLPELNERSESDATAAMVILIILAIAVAVLLIWGLFQLRKIKLGVKTVGQVKSSEIRQRPSLLRALARLFSALNRKVQIRIWLWKNRNTPKGLYCILVSQCGHTPWHKRTDETAREFLQRLQQLVAQDNSLHSALEQLIPTVDRTLYSRFRSHEIFAESSLLRRKVRKVVFRYHIRTCIILCRDTITRFIFNDNAQQT